MIYQKMLNIALLNVTYVIWKVDYATYQYAEIVTPKNADSVDIGTTVTIQFDDDEDELETYQIVGKQEVNVDDNKISFVSPIGKAIMHKKVGHTATVIAPAGSYTVKIISISI